MAEVPRRKIIIPSKKKEKLLMTMRELLQNPTGKNSAYFSRRDRIRADLEDRYKKLIKNYGKNFKMNIYSINNYYLFKFQIPSEDFGDKLYYDVFIKFIPFDKAAEKETTLSNYSVRLFSNSPNFTFTYTYVIYNSDMLVDELITKCNKKALRDSPKVRNPIETLGFEKSCYFAMLYIRENKLIYKSQLNNNLSVWSNDILKIVKSDEEKIAEYNKVKNEKKPKKKATSTTPKKSTPPKKPKRPFGGIIKRKR